jgi:uncharacterized protein YbjT (DUF2867 family)
LLAAGVPVRASSRDPESLRQVSAVSGEGGASGDSVASEAGVGRAELVAVDLTSPQTFPGALAGVRKVFLYAEPQHMGDFVDAAKAAEVEHIVLLSSASVVMPGTEGSPVALWHLAAERPIAGSGIPWTFVRPGAFATNTLQWSGTIRSEGVVRVPYPDSHTNPIHERDIAAVAVRALTSSGHEGAGYVLTGPESLSQRRQVELIGAAIGRELRCEEISPDEARGTIPEPLVRYLASTGGKSVPVSHVVPEVTGRPGLTYGQWASDHAADFR